MKKGLVLWTLGISVLAGILVFIYYAVFGNVLTFSAVMISAQYPYCGGSGSDCSTWNGDDITCTAAGCSWQDSCYGSVTCSSFGDEGSCSTYGCSWDAYCDNPNCVDQPSCEALFGCGSTWHGEPDNYCDDPNCVDSDSCEAPFGCGSFWVANCNDPGSDCSTWNGNDINCINAGCSWQDSCYGSVSSCESFGDEPTCSSYGCTWKTEPSCGDTITESIILTSDLTACSENGININANDIVLDCDGHSITGTGTIGIRIGNSVSGVTVKNCEISGFANGILSNNAEDNHILNNTIYNNGQYSMGIRQASSYTIADNKISNSSVGIRIVASSGNVIDNNTIINSHSSSISIYDSDDNNITDNTIQDADVNGIYLYTSGGLSNNLVQGNTISLSETDVAPLSKFGMRIEDDNNKIYDNTIDCTTINQDYNNMGIWIQSSNAENNVLSRNEISNCYYGFSAWNVGYFEVSDDEYHNNTYGAYLQSAGSSSSAPLIANSRIYDNVHGINILSNYINISNTNFTNNPGTERGRGSGIHVGSDATAYVTNGRFISNGEYGIYDLGIPAEYVYWTIKDKALCKDNDVQMYGNITFDGGTLEIDNCTISLNNLLLNLTGNITSLSSRTQDVITDTPTDFDFTEEDSNITLVLNTGVTTTIAVFSETPNASGTTAGLSALKGIDVQVDSTTSGALTWAFIKIFYNESELISANIDESTLKIYYYNTTLGDWQLEPNQGVDTINDYVWANITHFSLFGAFGTAPTAAAAAAAAISGGGGGCLTNWTCSEWSECINEVQTRTCTKINEYCYAGIKPEETQKCSIAQVIPEEPEKPIFAISPELKRKILSWLKTGSVIVISIIIIIIASVILIKFKPKRRTDFEVKYRLKD